MKACLYQNGQPLCQGQAVREADRLVFADDAGRYRICFGEGRIHIQSHNEVDVDLILMADGSRASVVSPFGILELSPSLLAYDWKDGRISVVYSLEQEEHQILLEWKAEG